MLRANLRPYIGSMLQSLRPHLSRVATSLPPVVAAGTGTKDASGKALAPATALVDDRLYVFEAVGLLLGQDEVAAEEQQALLTALLQPLLQQVREV